MLFFSNNQNGEGRWRLTKKAHRTNRRWEPRVKNLKGKLGKAGGRKRKVDL